MRRRLRVAITLAFLTVFALIPGEAPSGPGTTSRVSIHTSGDQGDDDSLLESSNTGDPVHSSSTISDDGQVVAFLSDATNLVGDFDSLGECFVGCDTNGFRDVFVRDRTNGTTSRVSVSSSEEQADSDSEFPAVSGNGRFVAFDTDATNLTSGDSGGVFNVFVRDQALGVTTLESKEFGGPDAADSYSYEPSLSGDGRFVAFTSFASDLVDPSISLNATTNIFVRDRTSGTTSLVSVSETDPNDGANEDSQQPAISSNARFVAFQSSATNIVTSPTMSGSNQNIYVRDSNGSNALISVNASGGEPNGDSSDPAISADGRFVVFESQASDIVAGDTNSGGDVFLRDRDTDADGIYDEPGASSTRRVSLDSNGAQGDLDSFQPSVSGDGRYTAYASWATNLVPGDTNQTCPVGFSDGPCRADIFLFDRISSVTDRVSVDSAGNQTTSGSDSLMPSISGNGLSVDFQSDAPNLVSNDTNASMDVFVRDRPPEIPERVPVPVLTLTPPLGPPGQPTLATGTGFPPLTTIGLTWDRGLGSATITSADDGSFQLFILVFQHDFLGPKILNASGGGVSASATYLVVPGTLNPPDFVSRR